MSFQTNVFINCPFDPEYKPLLRALIFTILYLNLEPQISKTTSSGKSRIQEIMKLIRESKYSIHDISRCEPLKTGELPRFNMPYEMGLDIGCCEYGGKKLKTKLCLILEKEKYRYHAVISDIGGQDTKDHNNEPKQLIEKVREWFYDILDANIPPASQIWDEYNQRMTKINAALISKGYKKDDIDNMQHQEFIKVVRSALQTFAITSITVTYP